jgi:apolipoprotein N-acyltransferase
MNQQTAAVLASWARVFLTAVLAGVATAITTNVWDWRALLFAGLAAVIPVVMNWLSPKDPRYGVGYVAPAEWVDEDA